MDLKGEAMTNGGNDNVNGILGLRKHLDLTICMNDICFRDINTDMVHENEKEMETRVS